MTGLINASLIVEKTHRESKVMKKENAPERPELNLLNTINRLPAEAIKRTANNARQRRLICKLVSSIGLTSKQVSEVTGASNPYSEIENVRKVGWHIVNTHHKGTDQDGRACRFDRYHLSPLQLKDAIRVVEFFNNAA